MYLRQKYDMKKILLNIYIIVTFCLFLFVNINSTVFMDYSCFFIQGKVIKIHFFFSCVCFLLFVFFAQKVHFDRISICLLLKCFFDLLPLIYIRGASFSEYLEYWAITIISFISYFMFANGEIDEKEKRRYKEIFLSFGFLLVVQVFVTFFKTPVSYHDVQYKLYMNIPYAGSNVIAAILVPMIILTYCDVKSVLRKIILITFFLVGVFLTKSRGGIVLSVATIFFLFLFANTQNKSVKRIFCLTICCFILLTLIVSQKNFLTDLFGFNNDEEIVWDKISSGRLSELVSLFKDYKIEYFFFGTGMRTIIGENEVGAHNIVIDLFIKCGLFGTFLYGFAFIEFLKNGRKLNEFKTNAFYLMAICIYFNSLYEVCYFSYKCDAILWIIIGMVISMNKKRKYEQSAKSLQRKEKESVGVCIN